MNLTESHILVQALSATNSPVTITDNLKPDNPIIYCNNAFISMTGYTKDEIINQNCRFLQGKDTDQKSVEKIRATLKDQTESKTILRNYRKDGTPFWNDLNISPVYNEKGVVTHFIGLQHDVTERIEQERAKAEASRLKREKQQLELEREKLLKLNEAKEDFIAVASHQLRTPATAVKQYLGMLYEGMLGEMTEAQANAVSQANKSNNHQLEIIDDLLRIARIDAGKVVLNRSQTNLGKLVAEVVQQFSYRLLDRELTLDVMLPEKDVILNIDLNLMQTVLENLIDNAVKYSQDKGTINVSLDTEKDDVIIRIIDNGIGISADDQARLFEKFTRSSSPTASNVGGTGLGLYWVKSVLDMHKAVINVRSTYGKGTMMEIILPNALKRLKTN
jgi:PAS domain S-box-containing protein